MQTNQPSGFLVIGPRNRIALYCIKYLAKDFEKIFNIRAHYFQYVADSYVKVV